MLEAIKMSKRDEKEKFLNKNHNLNATITDFWAWAYSDLVGNAERGILAEYIVAMALDVNHGTRTEWDSYDILSKDGIKVEVKSSGYIQTWTQKTYSNILFSIKATYAWDKQNNTYESIKKRQSDIYVFCVHKHKEQATINPLDLQQWEFYVLSSKMLNEKIPLQKTISLNRIKELGATLCDFENLNEVIHNQYNK